MPGPTQAWPQATLPGEKLAVLEFHTCFHYMYLYVPYMFHLFHSFSMFSMFHSHHFSSFLRIPPWFWSLGMAVVGRTSSQQKHLMQRCSERLRKTDLKSCRSTSCVGLVWPEVWQTSTETLFLYFKYFKHQKISKDIKRYQKFQRRTISKAFLLRRTPFKRAASQQFQTNPSHFQRQVCHQSLSEPYSQAVAGSARHNLQCCLPSVSNHLRKKNTQDSMYFNVFLLCASMCTQNLFTIFAASYGLLWPMHIEFPRQRTDLHLCHKAADALRLLWPITGKHLAHWAQYFWGSKKCSAIAMPSRDSRDPGALNFPFWWLQIAEWTESSCNSVGSLRDPKLHPFPKFTCRTYRRQVSDIADI